MVVELGEVEALSLCAQALNHVGAIVKEAHSFFGAYVENTIPKLDMLRTQTLLETDVDPSLIAKWGWNGDI